VSGQVTTINRELENKPELVNEDCYGRGWMVKIEPADPAEAQKLLSPDAYRELLKAALH
jgi:glycine cleavage system H protein